ncbi:MULTISPECIES: hypothetical protein [unclassified Moorena]|nr:MULTISPECIES: hypothetical protein [unclassified Moorena]
MRIFVPYSLLPTPCSLFPVPCSLFPVPFGIEQYNETKISETNP